MARVLAVVLALAASATSAGCAQLAGIDDTNNSAKANTVTLTRTSIGTKVTSAPLDLTGLTATYLLPGSPSFTAVPAMASSKPGVWSARMPNAEPVEFTLPDVPAPVPRLYEFPISAISVADVALEHPDPMPAPDGATMTVTVPLDAAPGANDSFQVFTVGAWGQRNFAAAELPAAGGLQLGPVTYAFSETANRGSSATLDRLTTQDAFFVLRYTVVGLTGVAEATPFDQTGTDNVTLPAMKPVAANQSFGATIDTAGYMTRYMEPMPAFSTLAMSWTISAAPGFATATPGLPLVVNFAVLATDAGINTSYGNPFLDRGWASLFVFNTNEQRVYTSAAGATLTLSAQMSQSLAPTPGPTVLDLPAGLPTLISINDSMLTADDQTIAAPTAPVTIRFQTDSGNCTQFDLGVFEVVPAAAAGQLTRVPVVAVTSDHAQFQVPPELFKAGSSYTMTAACTFGLYTAIAKGDFTKTQPPVARASLDSPVFTVTP